MRVYLRLHIPSDPPFSNAMRLQHTYAPAGKPEMDYLPRILGGVVANNPEVEVEVGPGTGGIIRK